jgi:serine/threonine protein phosphatase PrpC
MLTVAIRIVRGDRNEDRAAHGLLADQELLLLADGAGGISGGAAAAELAVSAFHSCWSATSDPVGALAQLDSVVATDHRSGETTFVFAVVHSGLVCGASVGDSGAWLVQLDGGVLELTAAQRRKPLVGSGVAVPISFGPHPIEGRLLLASDGLFKYVARERIVAAALTTDLDEAADALVAAPRLPNGKLQDDVAVVIAEATGETS